MTDCDTETPAWDWMVLVNDEGQHSLWPAINDIPTGWRAVGPTGTKEECTAYVDEHWTDMRPLSIRTAAASTAIH